MGAVVLGLLMFFVFVSMRVSSPEMKVLYTDLSPEDASGVAAKLEELKIPYKISPDGARVTVGEADVGRARMTLAQEGLPNGGSLGYELFDKQSGFGTTNFVQNITQVRALEGELARTISSLEHVRSARVHLVLPQRELFSRESRPATASVFLHLRGNASLSQEQIAGITSLIASAVPELKSKDVSIIDSAGNLLAQGGTDGDMLMTNKTEELRRNYEQRVTRQVEDLVSRTVGYGKVRVNIAADLNFDQMVQNEEVYDPATQVVRSAQTVEESSQETDPAAENVSVDNNLPGAGADLLADGASPTAQSNRVEETTNYEISKTTRNIVREVGDVKRISVAVLVDGTYTTDDKGVKTYKPRTEAELDQIAALVRSSVGFDASRGDTLEVVNMQFAEIETVPDDVSDKILGFDKGDILDAVEILTVAIMIILVVLLVLQPMVGRLLQTEKETMEDAGISPDLLPNMSQNPALMGPNMDQPEFSAGELLDTSEGGMIDVNKVEGRVKASSLKKVEDIVQAYPQETLSVIRSWMTQET